MTDLPPPPFAGCYYIDGGFGPGKDRPVRPTGLRFVDPKVTIACRC